MRTTENYSKSLASIYRDEAFAKIFFYTIPCWARLPKISSQMHRSNPTLSLRRQSLGSLTTADDDEIGVEIAMRVVRFAKGFSAVSIRFGEKLQVEMMKLLHMFITSSKPVIDILLITTIGFYIALDGVNLLGHGAHKYLNNVDKEGLLRDPENCHKYGMGYVSLCMAVSVLLTSSRFYRWMNCYNKLLLVCSHLASGEKGDKMRRNTDVAEILFYTPFPKTPKSLIVAHPKELLIKRESRFSDHRPVCAIFAVEVDVKSLNKDRFRKDGLYMQLWLSYFPPISENLAIRSVHSE
ncbi:hypothetical protein YC2023_009991 [Brassica napus]